MQRSLSIIALSLCATAATAAAQSVPTQVNFAGRLADADGNPLDGARNLVVKLFDAPTGGGTVWTEEHDGATFSRGLVYLTLGADRALDATVLDGGPLYLEITIDGTVMSPRLPLGSVPYAVRADVAAVADSAATLGTLAPDDVVTAVTAGAGLSGGGSGGGLALGLQPCNEGHFLAFSAGTWTCTPVPTPPVLTTAGGDAGTATTVARGDHLHDGRYFTEAELSSPGTLNAAANPLDWTRLKGVPASFADGVDHDTQYSAGAGIAQSGTQFAAAFTTAGGDAGTAATVARGDHTHDGRYLRGSAMHQVGAAAPAAYTLSAQRYVVDATPAEVGRVVALDVALTDALCRDLDGCTFTLTMVNYDPNQPGNRTSLSGYLGLSETSRWWRVSENFGAVGGFDGQSGVQEVRSFDCFFGDFETYTGSTNGRADSGVGFGLLNAAQNDFNDATTTCRVVIDD